PDALRRSEPGAGGGVLLVADPAAEPGPLLDQHAVPALAKRAGAGGRERDPLLTGLDLSRHADDHGLPPGPVAAHTRLTGPASCSAPSAPGRSGRSAPSRGAFRAARH